MIKKVFIAIDKFLNFLSGGSIKNTISGRVGYYANHANSYVKWYWNILQFIIDTTFYPMDGLNHCFNSYYKDVTKGDYKPTKRVIFFFLLSLFTVTACFVLIIPFYLLWLIGVLKPKNN